VARKIARNDYLLRAQIDDYEFTVFPDNRAIIKGTEDEDLAKTLYAKYIWRPDVCFPLCGTLCEGEIGYDLCPRRCPEPACAFLDGQRRRY